MSTITRERRVEFNDDMDELPSLDNDVENLCDALAGKNPRTAAIMRRRYEKKGLMKSSSFSEAPVLAPIAPKPLLAPLKAPAAPAVAPAVQPPAKLSPTKSLERPSVERTERKSWADMSTESENEGDVVESFASNDTVEGTGGNVGSTPHGVSAVQLPDAALAMPWDPLEIGEDSPEPSGYTPSSEKGTFWLKVWQTMTGKSVEEHLAQETSPQQQQQQQQMYPTIMSPMGPLTPEALSPTEGAVPGVPKNLTTGYVSASPPVMNATAPLSIQAVQAVPVQPMMMIFAPTQPLMANASPQTSMSFIPCARSEGASFQSVHSVQSEPEMQLPLPSAPCFHIKTAQLGQLSPDRRSFTKTKSKGRLSIASTDRLYSRGVARYCVQFVSGELSNADGVGIVFSSQLPCPQNIQRIVSIFANRTGRICMRADADVERSHVNIKAMELGDWLEVLCDFDSRKVTFTVWPHDGGNASSATVDFSGGSDRFRRLSAQVPSCAAGYLAVVLKHPGLTVTLGDA